MQGGMRMQVVCPNCKKQLKLREDKLPDTGTFRIACPGCSGDIVIERKSPRPVHEDSAEAEREEIPLEPEVFPPGVRAAFVFVEQPDIKQRLESALHKREYVLGSAHSIPEAAARMRMNRYHLVCVEYGEAGGAILDIINSWSGSRRREVNVVLLGNAARSLDPGQAFQYGVNSWLNSQDMDRFEELLDQVEDAYVRYRAPWDAVVES